MDTETKNEIERIKAYLKNQDKLKFDKQGNIVQRVDGGVYPMQWLWLVLTQIAIAFVLYSVFLGVLWMVLALVGTFKYAIDAADAAQDYTTTVAATYFANTA